MKEKVACAVVGATGRMGQHVCRLLSQADDFTIAGATETPGSRHIGQSLTGAIGLPDEPGLIAGSLDELKAPIDVIIDFTFPEVTMRTVEFAREHGVRTVIGTTGFSEEQMRRIRQSTLDFACVCAPNMSLGVTVLFKLVRDVALVLHEGYDAEVLEIHHRHKKDAPSGTADTLARILADVRGQQLDQVVRHGRQGIPGERTRTEIGMHSIRGGDVVGDHTVMFAGLGERVELTHKASSRETFANGALRAAIWVAGKQQGIYDMLDVLGLK
jgi:4-hydroxy-tetrahydrodipicolinate reductase